MLKRVGKSRHPCWTPAVVQNQASMLLLKRTALDDDDDELEKVCANVVLLHGCPQSCMPNPVKGLLEVYEDMVEVLLVLEFWHCCRLPFLGSVMSKGWVHGVGHSPVCQILLQIVVRVVITSSPPTWTSSAGMLSTPTDFPFFNDCTAASTKHVGLKYIFDYWDRW